MSHSRQAVKSLTLKVQEAKATSIPKRRFAFKTRSPDVEIASSHEAPSGLSTHSKDAAIEDVYNESQLSPPPTKYDLATININGCRAEQVILPPLHSSDERIPQTSASISNVEDCIINLRNQSSHQNPLAKLHIDGVRRSLILCGHLSGSVFLSNSRDCALLVTSGQMRLYQCENCTIYLHCTSKPVIERSNGIKFAPLPSTLVRGCIPLPFFL